MLLLTPREVALRLGVDRVTVYKMIKDGTLPAYRLGNRSWRITEEAVVSTLSAFVPAGSENDEQKN